MDYSLHSGFMFAADLRRNARPVPQTPELTEWVRQRIS
jgi:hypothetical protein